MSSKGDDLRVSEPTKEVEEVRRRVGKGRVTVEGLRGRRIAVGVRDRREV